MSLLLRSIPFIKLVSARLSTNVQHPSRTLPKPVESALLEGSATVGMTPEELELVAGSPSRVNRSGGSFGLSEQWIYDPSYSPKTRIFYFRNGLLKSWQEY